jgi:hypothetical protein
MFNNGIRYICYMKKSLYLLAICFIAISSCKKDDEQADLTTPEELPTVRLEVKNQIDGQPISIGVLNYTNPAGETYSVDLLRYYFSYATLIDESNNEVKLNDHTLIDAFIPADNIISNTVAKGHYTKLRFYIGVDEVHNHTGAQEGDLDPIYGMLWTWDTGYVFFKHEGQFVDADGNTSGMSYHYAKDNAYKMVEIPIDLHIESGSKNMDVVFNLNDLYRSPYVIQFDGNNYHQSISVNDAEWLQQMFANFGTAFSVSIP